MTVTKEQMLAMNETERRELGKEIFGELLKRNPELRLDKKDSSKRTYIRGSGGGCYYLNSNGKKVYVDRELCS